LSLAVIRSITDHEEPPSFETSSAYESAPAGYITVWSRGGGDGYVENPDARGLVFEVGQDGAVKAIRAGGPSIQYVEGCA